VVVQCQALVGQVPLTNLHLQEVIVIPLLQYLHLYLLLELLFLLLSLVQELHCQQLWERLGLVWELLGKMRLTWEDSRPCWRPGGSLPISQVVVKFSERSFIKFMFSSNVIISRNCIRILLSMFAHKFQ